MKNSNPTKKKILKQDLKASFRDSTMQLADFFNGVVIKLDEVNIYDE